MTIPSWNAIHPLVVHFPIALLLVAPLFVVLAMIYPKAKLSLGVAALVLMLLGTATIYLAFATGEATEDQAEGIVKVEAVLEAHEEAAEMARVVFTLLTAIYATLLLLPVALKRELPRASAIVAGLAFLVLYMGGSALLVNVGHQGARLVHEFGVRAPLYPVQDAVPLASLNDSDEEHHSDE